MPPSQQDDRLSDVMTHRVRTVDPTQPLREVWQLLVDERCHHVPVVDQGRPVGMISTRDLVHFAHINGTSPDPSGTDGEETAADVMSTNLETLDVEASVDDAIDRIGRGDIHALVIVDDKGKLAGIVTHHDLLEYMIR